MNIFRSLGFKRKSKEPSEPPLSEPALRALRGLLKHDGWKIYLQLLDGKVYILSEALLYEENTERLHGLRGELKGLRTAVSVPQRMLRQEEALNARERDRELAGRDERRAERVALYGTPGWNR